MRSPLSCYDPAVIDEELVSPEAFALAVRARASFFARHIIDHEADSLRPYAQLTLLLGVELDTALDALTSRGLRGAYRWVMDGSSLDVAPVLRGGKEDVASSQ